MTELTQDIHEGATSFELRKARAEIGDLCGDITAKNKEIERLRDELTAAMLERDELKHVAVRMTDLNISASEGHPFRAEATFKGDAVKIFAASVMQWFREQKGDNFVTCEVTDSETRERYELTMRRAGAKTPAQELAVLRRDLANPTYRANVWGSSGAWDAVHEQLSRHNPNTFLVGKTGIDCALHEIRRLQDLDKAAQP